MVKSMTGYGRCEETVGGRRITVELKSVNHKYFEFSPRVTRGYGFLEDKLKTYVQSRVARGKIDLFLSIETLEDADVIVSVNHSLAAGYIAALREITERYKLPDTVTVNSLSRYSDIFSGTRRPRMRRPSGRRSRPCWKRPSTPSSRCARRKADAFTTT